jgi:hypothetical protein
MVQQITNSHLDFVQEAKEAFQSDPGLYTWRNENETLIALRYGMDRDCVLVYELGECIANFVQQTTPAPDPRKEVILFSHDMEAQLKVNEHKGGWSNSSDSFLYRQLERNLAVLDHELAKDDRDKHEITIRCANIANYAMMIADNEGEHL